MQALQLLVRGFQSQVQGLHLPVQRLQMLVRSYAQPVVFMVQPIAIILLVFVINAQRIAIVAPKFVFKT